MTTIYKILVNGKSCHGGNFTWSLPKDGSPGEWHEVAGPLSLCSVGFHLTDNPAKWWLANATAYVVQAEGVVGSCEDRPDRKIVARRVRLVREATTAELESAGIYVAGLVRANEGMIFASGSATVEASGSATVEASGSATVEASGSATVRAYGSATVRAYDSATVEASGSATVEGCDDVTVVSWRGCRTVKVTERAAWVDRSEHGTAPKVHVAAEDDE